MTLRCRPGDLAIVIHPAENTGLFVTVLARGRDHPQTGHPSWNCRVAAPCKVTTVASLLGIPVHLVKHTVPAGAEVLFRDIELQPIRPPKPPQAIPAPPVELETTE